MYQRAETSDVSKEIRKLKLEHDESLVSLDVTQLYTHVPLDESIEMAAIKLYSYEIRDDVPVDINTFITGGQIKVTDF